jgi:hypothetical protein
MEMYDHHHDRRNDGGLLKFERFVDSRSYWVMGDEQSMYNTYNTRMKVLVPCCCIEQRGLYFRFVVFKIENGDVRQSDSHLLNLNSTRGCGIVFVP